MLEWLNLPWLTALLEKTKSLTPEEEDWTEKEIGEEEEMVDVLPAGLMKVYGLILKLRKERERLEKIVEQGEDGFEAEDDLEEVSGQLEHLEDLFWRETKYWLNSHSIGYYDWVEIREKGVIVTWMSDDWAEENRESYEYKGPGKLHTAS